MDNIKLEDKLIWIKGLLLECPMGKPLDDCPAEKYRKFPIKERMKIVNEMKIEEIEFIIKHHKECLRKREERYNNIEYRFGNHCNIDVLGISLSLFQPVMLKIPSF